MNVRTDTGLNDVFQTAVYHLKNWDVEQGLRSARQLLERSVQEGEPVFEFQARAILCDFYRFVCDTDKAQIQLQKAMDIAEHLQDDKLRLRAKYRYAELCNEIGDYSKALTIVDECDALCTGDTMYIIALCNVRAMAYAFSGNISKAFDLYQQCLPICEEHGFILQKSIIYSHIGMLFIEISDHEQALHVYQKAVEILSNEYYNHKAPCYVDMARCYIHLHDYEHAEQYILESIELCKKHKLDAYGYSARLCYAKLCSATNRYDEALTIYHDIHAYFTLKEQAQKKQAYLFQLAELYATKDWSGYNAQKAFALYREAMQIHLKHQDTRAIANAHRGIAQLFKDAGDYHNAYTHLETSNLLEAELQTEQSHKRAEILESQLKLYWTRKEKKILEEKNTELEVLNKRLGEQQEEIQQYNIELEKANYELQRIYEQKKDVIAIAAHQLKSPLIELKYTAKEALLHPQKKTLQNSWNEAERIADTLLQRVEKFISLSSMAGRSALSLTKINLSSLLKDIISTHSRSAETKQISIVELIPSACEINSDEFALTQIVDNLLSNAIKYTPPGLSVGVRLKNLNDSVQIHIWDEGLGFSEEDKLHLYEKYQRLSSAPTGEESSSGLGLSIIKNFIAILQGDIRIISEKGKGSEFIISIPVHHF